MDHKSEALRGKSLGIAEDLSGTNLGRFRVLEPLGVGGMGVLYRAHDQRLDRDVALKVLPAGMLADEAARRRFRYEALTLSRLNHPNIETLYDFDTEHGVDFLVIEHVPGQTLEDRLGTGALPEAEVIALGRQLVEGIAAAHQSGIVHLDLKPANLCLRPDGRLKILDFGIAKLLDANPEPVVNSETAEIRPALLAAERDTASLHTPNLSGTVPYMAPEQLRGGEVDVRTDVYAAGAVLFEMAFGERPFTKVRVAPLVLEILHTRPKPSRKHPVSIRLGQLILKALEKDPRDRYQSAREMLAELESIALARRRSRKAS
jgi:eukaryotic-like serine/threonine-protein kinase